VYQNVFNVHGDTSSSDGLAWSLKDFVYSSALTQIKVVTAAGQDRRRRKQPIGPLNGSGWLPGSPG
jgi:hypothetical protein